MAVTNAILPLYSYPTDPEWATVESSVVQYPNIDFILIINPDSGPGPATPEQAFVTGVTKLKSYDNVKVIGYINTMKATRDQADVENDVTLYAGWTEAARVQGVFFDNTAQDNIPYYTAVGDFAKSEIENAVIVFNPGTVAAPAYFSVADQVMIYEDSYDNYRNQTIPSISPTQFSVLIHSMPSDDIIENYVNDLVSNQYGSIYLTLGPPTYQSLGDDWNTFCGYMNKALDASAVDATPAGGPVAPSKSSSSSSRSLTSTSAEKTVTEDSTRTPPHALLVTVAPPGTSSDMANVLPTGKTTPLSASEVNKPSSETEPPSRTTTATTTRRRKHIHNRTCRGN
jgi:hypothetical protein